MEYQFNVGETVLINSTHFAEGSTGKVVARRFNILPSLSRDLLLPGKSYDVLLDDFYPAKFEDGNMVCVRERGLEKWIKPSN
jgi:hypothetical protein